MSAPPTWESIQWRPGDPDIEAVEVVAVPGPPPGPCRHVGAYTDGVRCLGCGEVIPEDTPGLQEARAAIAAMPRWTL
jgi:hypothetical protein